MLTTWGSLPRHEVTRAFEEGAPCLLGTAAIEQHGEHLPTDTDMFVLEAILAAAAPIVERRVITLPTLPFGFSPYHQRFGATVSLSSSTYMAVLNDICESTRRAGAQALVIINSHGGNESPLRMVSHECSDEGFTVAVASYWELAQPSAQALFTADQGQIGHAGQAETALSLALRPEAVRNGRRSFEPTRTVPRPPTVEQLGESGVIGDPGSATPELGSAFFDAVVAGLANYLDALPH